MATLPMKVRRSFLIGLKKQLEQEGKQNTETYKNVSELCKIKKTNFIIKD